MTNELVDEITELENKRIRLDQQAEEIDSTVRRVQLWGTLISFIVTAVILGLISDDGLEYGEFLIAVPFGVLFLGSLGYGLRDSVYDDEHTASTAQDKLACTLIEAKLEGTILKREYGDLFATRYQEFTLKVGDVVCDYFIRVEKFTGEVYSYPRVVASV